LSGGQVPPLAPPPPPPPVNTILKHGDCD